MKSNDRDSAATLAIPDDPSEIPAGGITLRAARSAYFVSGAMWSIPIVLGIAATFKNAETIWVCAVGALALGLSYWWIAGFRIVISKESLAYQSRFGVEVSIPWSQIKSARVPSGLPIRLEIEGRDSAGNNIEVTINLKIFGREVWRLLGPLRHARSDNADRSPKRMFE